MTVLRFELPLLFWYQVGDFQMEELVCVELSHSGAGFAFSSPLF